MRRVLCKGIQQNGTSGQTKGHTDPRRPDTQTTQGDNYGWNHFWLVLHWIRGRDRKSELCCWQSGAALFFSQMLELCTVRLFVLQLERTAPMRTMFLQNKQEETETEKESAQKRQGYQCGYQVHTVLRFCDSVVRELHKHSSGSPVGFSWS